MPKTNLPCTLDDLVGDLVVVLKARLEVADITAVERVARTFMITAAGLGATISLGKTKMMSKSCPEAGDNMPKELKNGVIAVVDNFAYLGSNISNDDLRCVLACRLNVCCHDIYIVA